jgi:hypothetical protein
MAAVGPSASAVKPSGAYPSGAVPSGGAAASKPAASGSGTTPALPESTGAASSNMVSLGGLVLAVFGAFLA